MRTGLIRCGVLFGTGFLAIALSLVPQAAGASSAKSRFVDGGPTGVSPKLSLPGCSRQDGFNGNISWNNGDGTSVRAWGEVWDVCGTTATVWLSWTDPGGHNVNIGHAPPDKTNGVNYSNSGGILSTGNVSIAVCAWWQGIWRCGTPVHV
jgi:hypothetical protein